MDWTELENGARLRTQGDAMEIFSQDWPGRGGGGEAGWKHRTLVDGFSCLRLHTHITKLGCIYVYTSCKPLMFLFSLQGKSKPNGGIALPAFILRPGMITNSYNSLKL